MTPCLTVALLTHVESDISKQMPEVQRITEDQIGLSSWSSLTVFKSEDMKNTLRARDLRPVIKLPMQSERSKRRLKKA